MRNQVLNLDLYCSNHDDKSSLLLICENLPSLNIEIPNRLYIVNYRRQYIYVTNWVLM